MLEIKDLYVGYYEDLHILRGLSLTAETGKMTDDSWRERRRQIHLAQRRFTASSSPIAGKCCLNDDDVTGTPTHRLIDLGISYIPQQPGVFKHMSVRENLMLGAWTFQKDKKRIESKIEDNFNRFPILREKQHDHAGSLSGGQQRMVEIGRTLMTDPGGDTG